MCVSVFRFWSNSDKISLWFDVLSLALELEPICPFSGVWAIFWSCPPCSGPLTYHKSLQTLKSSLIKIFTAQLTPSLDQLLASRGHWVVGTKKFSTVVSKLLIICMRVNMLLFWQGSVKKEHWVSHSLEIWTSASDHNTQFCLEIISQSRMMSVESEAVSEGRWFRKPNQSKTNFSLSQNIFTQSNLNKVWVYLIQSIQICSNFFINFLKQPNRSLVPWKMNQSTPKQSFQTQKISELDFTQFYRQNKHSRDTNLRQKLT